MTIAEDLEDMKTARDKAAKVYKSQATDSIVDNGNLSNINTAILNINHVIKWLEDHLPP